MRSPSYNSSEEEPEYYGEYGESLFLIGKYKNKENRKGLSPEESLLLQSALESVPIEVLGDYTSRRATNLAVLQECIALVKNKDIDFLLIPQDDSAPHSFAATEQKTIFGQIDAEELWENVQSYPGADESACALLARMENHLNKRTPMVYAYYASIDGASFVPKYEDRPFGESVKAHLLVQGARQALSPQDADYMLFINIPGVSMCEAWEQKDKDLSYSTHRNLSEFVKQIKMAQEQGKPCILADVAFSNGGDIQLLTMLAKAELLPNLVAYAGWNTACNALGTALSAAFCLHGNKHKQEKYLQYRIMEDLLYQSIVRQTVIKEYLPTIGASYYDMNNRQQDVENRIKESILDLWNMNFSGCFTNNLNIASCKLPWHRMFEVDIKTI